MSSVKTREAYEMQVASFEKEHAEFANSETKIDAMMEQLNEAAMKEAAQNSNCILAIITGAEQARVIRSAGG